MGAKCLVASLSEAHTGCFARAELVEITRRIYEAEGSAYATDFYLGLLQANVPDPRIAELIFWPDLYFNDGKGDRKMGPEEIVHIALRTQHKPQ